MKFKFIFSALLLSFAVVVFLALYQAPLISDFKKSQFRKHFDSPSAPEDPAWYKSVQDLRGASNFNCDAKTDAKEKSKCLGESLYYWIDFNYGAELAKKPKDGNGGCAAAATTSASSIYASFKKTEAQRTADEKCLFTAYNLALQKDKDDVAPFLISIFNGAYRVEPERTKVFATKDVLESGYLENTRLVKAVCGLPYDKITAEMLRNPESDATNKACITQTALAFDNWNPDLIKAFGDIYELQNDKKVDAKAAALLPVLLAECKATCTDAAAKTVCEASCDEESKKYSPLYANLLLRLQHVCGLDFDIAISAVKIAFKTDTDPNHDCVKKAVEQEYKLGF